MVAVFAVVVLVYLFVPVAYTFAFSFNNYTQVQHHLDPSGSPTLKHWENPCGAPGVCDALVTSIKIGAARHARRHGPRHDDRVRRWSATGSAAGPPRTC